MNKLEIKSKETLRSAYLDPAINEGSDKSTSKNQMYYKIKIYKYLKIIFRIYL